MKVCYVDESGTADDSVIVVAGVIVDGMRMHLTKAHWSELLQQFEAVLGRTVREFHAKPFYSGRGIWRELSLDDRRRITEAILDWLERRQHATVFSGVDRTRWARQPVGAPVLDLTSPYCAAMFHLILGVQKSHQAIGNRKGHTILILDESPHRSDLLALFRSPPAWTDAYYERRRRAGQLDQIVDVPYFANSESVLLLQVADFIAYLLRRYVELTRAGAERYRGESADITEWAQRIASRAQQAAIWPLARATTAHETLRPVAPDELRILRA